MTKYPRKGSSWWSPKLCTSKFLKSSSGRWGIPGMLCTGFKNSSLLLINSTNLTWALLLLETSAFLLCPQKSYPILLQMSTLLSWAHLNQTCSLNTVKLQHVSSLPWEQWKVCLKDSKVEIWDISSSLPFPCITPSCLVIPATTQSRGSLWE